MSLVSDIRHIVYLNGSLLIVLSGSRLFNLVPFSVIQREKVSLYEGTLKSSLALDYPDILTIIPTAAAAEKLNFLQMCGVPTLSNSVRLCTFFPVLSPEVSDPLVLRLFADPYQAVRWRRNLKSL